MTTTPKISIIIPVYNVEKYLAECLDSVVNQTMRDIQIICVNDGSPDNSRAILQEYADEDSRIEIIDKPNGGLSSARNAAYPSIKGKYTLFVDSDDWIDSKLCEKTYHKAEETGAQMVFFFCQRQEVQSILTNDIMTVEEKFLILGFAAAWCRLWRSDLLLNNKLYFPEGLVSEDNLVHWQAVTLAERISIVPERLYYWRETPGSITQTIGKHWMDAIPVYNKIRDYLLESDYYTAYRDKFIQQKLRAWHDHCQHLPVSMRAQCMALIRESLTEDDRKFFRNASEELVPKTRRLFYKMIDGGLIEMVNYHIHISPIRLRVKSIIRMPEQLLRWWIIKPVKKLLT